MHSYDRTLIASLGFADPDKREPLHDLACQYLAEPGPSRKLWEAILAKHFTSKWSPDQKLARRNFHEFVITKGEGKYKTTIGFIDLKIEYSRVVEAAKPDGSTYEDCWQMANLAIEVKVHPVPIGDVVRQINLYKQFVNDNLSEPLTGWLLATTYQLSEGDAALLRSQLIHWAHLGENFQRWIAERQAAAPAVGIAL
jgi:hypothetical protein